MLWSKFPQHEYKERKCSSGLKRNAHMLGNMHASDDKIPSNEEEYTCGIIGSPEELMPTCCEVRKCPHWRMKCMPNKRNSHRPQESCTQCLHKLLKWSYWVDNAYILIINASWTDKHASRPSGISLLTQKCLQVSIDLCKLVAHVLTYVIQGSQSVYG